MPKIYRRANSPTNETSCFLKRRGWLQAVEDKGTAYNIGNSICRVLKVCHEVVDVPISVAYERQYDSLSRRGVQEKVNARLLDLNDCISMLQRALCDAQKRIGCLWRFVRLNGIGLAASHRQIDTRSVDLSRARREPDRL